MVYCAFAFDFASFVGLGLGIGIGWDWCWTNRVFVSTKRPNDRACARP